MASERSVWAWIGIGCAGLAAFGLAAAVVLGVWAYRGTQRLKAEMADPAARTANALRVLGTDRLPDGYHAMAAFSIPWVMDVALLSGNAPDEKGKIHDFGEHGLIYVEMFHLGQDEQELRDYFEGRTDDPGVLRRNRINIDADEIISRGTVPAGKATLMYVAQRGSVSSQGFRGGGITAVVLVDCPDDERMRTAIWFGPDPAPRQAVDEIDLAGTPADEAAIAALLGRFRFCG